MFGRLRHLKFTAAMVLVALAVCVLVPLSSSRNTENAPTAIQQVTQSDVRLVSSYTDCFYAASEIYGGLAIKGLRVAVNANRLKSFFASVAGLIPGVNCGKYLGHHNVNMICAATRLPWWAPPGITARNFVWVVTGGQTNRC